MNNEATTPNRPSHIIFAIETRNDKSTWTEIGAAWTNKDGSLNLSYKFLPADMTNVRIQLLENKPKQVEVKPYHAGFQAGMPTEGSASLWSEREPRTYIAAGL